MEMDKDSSIELLNTLLYYNYGHIPSSKCVDLSPTHRLAVVTEKCIYIMNLNFEWPSNLKNTNPSKYFLKINSHQNTNNSANVNNKRQPVYLDTWINDLKESSNESFYINLVKHACKSSLVTDMYKRFFSLDLLGEAQTRRKSFYKQIREKITENQRQQKKRQSGRNEEQYMSHRFLCNQLRLFDSDYYEYLNYLVSDRVTANGSSANPASDQVNFYEGYKLCKWNNSTRRHLLATVSRTNQILIFDCTRLREHSPINVANAPNDATDEFTTTFDSNSKSTCLNLTELWLSRYKSNLVKVKSRKLNDYLAALNDIIPTCVCWCEVELADLAGELFVVAFKSNQIACFLIGDELQATLVCLIDLSDVKFDAESDDDIELDEAENNESPCLRYQITAMHFGAHVLSVGLSNGNIVLVKINLDRTLIKQLADDSDKNTQKSDTDRRVYCQYTIMKTGVEFFIASRCNRICVHPIRDNVYVSVLLNNESALKFVLFKIDKDQVVCIQTSTRHFNELNQAVEAGKQNFLTKNVIRLVDYDLKFDSSDQFNLMAVFENSFIERLTLKIDPQELKFSLDHWPTSAKLDDFTSDKLMNSFKSTRFVRMSQTGHLAWQLVDLTKTSLTQKRSPTFQVNVFKMRKNLSIDQSLKANSLVNVHDMLWFYKHQLFLNNVTLMTQVFKCLYDNLRNYKNFPAELATGYLTYLKRLRVLAHFMGVYYGTVTEFDRAVEGTRSDMDEDEEDDDDDEEEEEEEAEMVGGEDTLMIDEDSVTESTSSVIKSADYYKSVFRELSLLIFRFHSFEILTTAYETSDVESFTDHERLLLILVGDFSVKKNFFADDFFLNGRIRTKVADLEKWLKEKLPNISGHNQSLIDLMKSKFNCDLCGKGFNFEANLDLNKITCQSNHTMKRCEKTLFPLNNFHFKQCSICKSTWNYVNKDEDYPHFAALNRVNSDNCLYCN